jgi:hypothetical protein
MKDFVSIGSNCGMPGVAQRVKLLSQEARSMIFNSWGVDKTRFLNRYFGTWFRHRPPRKDQLWMFENISRCLPAPSPDELVTIKAIRDTTDRLTSVPNVPTNNALNVDLYNFVLDTFYPEIAKDTKLLEQRFRLQAGPAACLETSRAKGGAYAYLSEVHQTLVSRINDRFGTMRKILGEEKFRKLLPLSADHKVPIWDVGRGLYMSDYEIQFYKRFEPDYSRPWYQVEADKAWLLLASRSSAELAREITPGNIGVFNAQPSLTTWKIAIWENYSETSLTWLKNDCFEGKLRIPQVRLTPVGVNGYKTRVVGKTAAAMTGMLTPASDQVSRLIRRHAALKAAFEAAPQEIARRLTRLHMGGFLCESDLSAATDLSNQ